MTVKPSVPISVLFIASEAEPFVKIGGLGDVAGSLPFAMHKTGEVDIRLAIPFYNQLKNKELEKNHVASFPVESTIGPVTADVYSTTLSGMPVYLISGEPVTRNPAVYGTDFRSDAEKFVFFSLAALQLPAVLAWKLDILHTNDWHTAIATYELEKFKKYFSEIDKARSVLTLHNLPFMGTGSEFALDLYGIEPSGNQHIPPWGRQLPLPMGLSTADRIVAVSPSYANEILTPEYGCDLQDFLKTRRCHITGILNGLDTQTWNPETDAFIVRQFNERDLEGKKACKVALQKEFGLEERPDVPLLILISRMDPQKGVDIAIDGLRRIKNVPWQVILLGTGDPRLEESCRSLSADFPKKVKSAILFDSKLSHRMYAGADILMMPSRYEPCGLAQMIAMRYGCIPVARATGGLIDSINHVDENNDGTGFLFSSADPESFTRALLKAMVTFHQPGSWNKIQRQAMVQDFSWSRSAQEYIDLYRELIPS